MGVPPPTLCPEERQRRRTAFRNFRNLYHRNCDGSGKKLISMYDVDSPFPVYDRDYWWSDAWQAQSYGRDFDFSRPFFPQYKELLDCVPRFALMQMHSENCAYTNFTLDSRDCYMVFGCVRNEHCMYGHIVWRSEQCVDNLYLYRCQWCSSSIDLVDCYDVHFSTDCVGCVESYFLHDCRNCRNCFGCVNLRGKEYCFQNIQLSRAEYERRLQQEFLRTPSNIEQWYAWLAQRRIDTAVFSPSFGSKNEDSTGNHLVECKAVAESFDIKQSEYLRYCYTVDATENSMDLSFCGGGARYSIEGLTIRGDELRFCHQAFESNNCDYCHFCYSSENLFGCMGIRSGKFCILNKQYSPADYAALKARIIDHMKSTGEWGEFFPMELSSFAYNESIAHEYQPLLREEVLRRGLRWKEEANDTKSTKALPRTPEHIAEAGDNIPQQIFSCEKTGKAYKVSLAELEFYRRVGLPLPRLCPDVRHAERMKLRGPRRLWPARCMACKTAISSAIDPSEGRQVFCERCYLERLY